MSVSRSLQFYQLNELLQSELTLMKYLTTSMIARQEMWTSDYDDLNSKGQRRLQGC